MDNKRLPGYVYVIDYGDGKTFKIGRSKDPIKRLKQISRGSVLMPMQLVMYGYTAQSCRILEGMLHMKFGEYNVQGEWFQLDFTQLVDIYTIFASFCADIELCDRWYEVVPSNYLEYFEHEAILVSDYLPHFEPGKKLSFEVRQ